MGIILFRLMTTVLGLCVDKRRAQRSRERERERFSTSAERSKIKLIKMDIKEGRKTTREAEKKTNVLKQKRYIKNIKRF